MEFDNDIIEKLREQHSIKNIRYSKHALDQMQKREVLRTEITYVFESAEIFLERRKCKWDSKNNCWKYSVKATSFNENILRIVFALTKKNNVTIITVIKLAK